MDGREQWAWRYPIWDLNSTLGVASQIRLRVVLAAPMKSSPVDWYRVVR